MSSCIFISSSSEENQDYLKLVDSIKEGFNTNLPLFDSDNKPTKELFQSLERSVDRITGQFKTGNRDILAQAISKALFDLELAPGTIDNIRELVDKDIISKFVTKYAKLIEYKPQFQVNKFSDSLDTLFQNYTDINRFRNQFRGNLTNRFFITNSGRIVKTNEDFNSSIQNYKQELFDALRSRALAKIKDSTNIEDIGLRQRLLTYNLSNPGVDNRLITQDIERMLKLVESSFKLVNGKFTSGDFGLYSQYISFKYFDQLIEQLLGDSISINPISNRYFKSSGKYTRNLGQQVNQRFEDDTISYSDEANKVLMRFISSIRSPNGNYLNFNDFTAALHYIRTKFPDYIGQIRMKPSLIRDLWRKAVEKANLDSKVANNIKNAITAIYGRVYSDAENSLYNLYKNEGNVKYNLYTFINNSINSATPARYLSTGINEDGEAETKEMTQVVNQTRINSIASAIMLATKKSTFTNVGQKLGISKITNDYDKLSGFQFSDFKLLFNTKSLALVTKDGNELTSAKNKASYIRDHSEMFRNLLTDILNRPMSQEYWKQLLISDDADISGLLDLAVAALISYDYNENIVNNEDDMLTMTGRLLDTLDRNKMPLEPKKIGKLLDFTTKMVNPRAIFKATDGLFAINAANDYFNGNLNKSYIVDSTGAHLPLMTVTSAMADDKIIVSKIKSDAMHPFYSNLFYNQDLIGESFINQEFVTKDGRSKTIASMTAQELGYYDFVYRYLLAGDTMYFQPTVYSDKSRIWVKPLYLNKPINTNIAELEDINTKTLNELNIDDIKRVHRFTMRNQFNKYIDTYNKNLVLVVNKVLETRKEQPLKVQDYFSNIKAANELEIKSAELNNAILELQNNGQEVELFHEAQFKDNGSVITFGNSNLDFYNSYFSDDKVYNLKNSIEDKLYAFQLQDNDINIFTVNSDGTLNERLDSIAKSQPEWYDENTKKMIMYRVKQNGRLVDKDLTIDDCFDSEYSIEFNPIVERYLALNRLAQDNYNAMLFGFSFAHKGNTLKNWYNMPSITYEGINKNIRQLLEEESSRQTAEWKRGVIGGATIHPVAQGLLNGVPSTYKIACIEDLSDKLVTWHVSDMGKGVNNLPVTPHDGGIFINPFISVLENNSMPDIKVSDVAKKPIVHIDLSKVGMAGLLKCATFSLNNEYIRNSEAKTEYDENGTRLDDRLNGKDLLARMADIQWESFPPINKTYTNQYYYNTVEHKYFRVVKIQQVSDSLYDVVIKEVDNRGNNINKEFTTKHININSNYDLWDILGGEWSCSKVDGELVLSESSIDEVVNIMNDYNIAKEGTTAESPKTQEYYTQPMKDANIAYLVNRSAFKNGPANVSPTEKFFQPYQKIGKYSIPYQTIETTWLGIQLNAEHDLEDSHITEMSQVISALEQGGITHDIAIVIYKNIGRTIANYLETYYKEANLDDPAANAVAQVFSDLEKREKLYFILGSKLIAAYASRDNSIGLTQAYLNSVRDSIEREKIENDTPLIPFNDPNICQVLQTAFTSGLNRDIIRRAYDGVAAVQAPSSNLVTIYDTPQGPMKYTDLVMSSESSADFIKKMNELNREVDSRDVQIGDYVQITYANGKIKKGRVSGYKNPNGIGLVDLLNLEDKATVTLLGSKGRGLRSENATFTLEGLPKKLSLYDLDSSRLSWELYDLLKVSNDETFDDFYSKLDDYNKARITDVLFRLYGTDEGNLGFKTAITKYLNSDKSNYKNIAGFLNESLQKEFNNLETGVISIPVLYRKDLNDRTPVAVTSINRQANEIMVGKLWAKEFGLRKGDNLYQILNEGPEFFKDRLKDRYTIPLDENKFDMVYTKPDGNHLYVITDTNRIRQIYRNDFVNFTIDNKARYTYINGKKYYVKDNQPQYPIPKDAEIYHYTDNKIVYDIVYIPDGKLERFNKDIESTNQYTGLWISSTSNQKNVLVKMPSKLMNKQLANYLAENKSFQDLRNLELEQTAQKMYISFKQATNFIGGRIPSQSMQSFMNCKVAGYIDMDSNIVWVNNAVLVFQGSKNLDPNYMNCWKYY